MRATHAILTSAAAATAVVLACACFWRARAQGQRVAGVQLSVFEPHAGGCAWFRWDAFRREEQPVAHFPNDCVNVQAVWDSTGAEALVWFMPEGFPSQEDMLFLVQVATQTVRRLKLPEVGEPQAYLFDQGGRILALTENQLVTLLTEGEDGHEQRFLAWHGQRWPATTLPEDGQAVLVHALELDRQSESWRVVETQPSRCCTEGAPGFRVLAAYDRLQASHADRQTDRLLRAPATSQPVNAASLLGPSPPPLPLPPGTEPTDLAWRLVADPAWPRALLFHGTGGEPPVATGVAFFTAQGRAQAIPGFNFGTSDVLQVMTRGPFLLVADWSSGTEPHLYDMTTGQLVFSSPVAVATTFWPQPIDSR